MSKSNLLPNEQIVMSSSDGALVLTNFRVKHESVGGGVNTYRSIPISKISACALTTKKYLVFLVLAGIGGVGIFAAPVDQGRILAAITSFVFLLLYAFTRSGQIEVFSDSGTSIAVPTKGLKHEEARGFAEAVAFTIASPR